MTPYPVPTASPTAAWPIASRAPTAAFYGDSIEDPATGPNLVTWPDDLCAARGWRRVGKGTAADPTRAAIAGTPAQYNPTPPAVPSSGQGDVATRLAIYAPDLVFACLGTNDYFQANEARTWLTFSRAYDAMMVAVYAMAVRPRVCIVGITNLEVSHGNTRPAPASGVPSWAADLRTLRAGYQTILANLGARWGAVYADMGVALTAAQAPDGTHPTTAAGNALYTSRVGAAIDAVAAR
jgi:hypothetical protein